jgi:hypothetical protein
MALKLSQSEIDEMARDGVIREEDGRRVHKMSPLNRPETSEPDGPEPQKGDDIGASLRLIAAAINDSTAQQKEFCNLMREILTQCLQSHAN